MTRDIEKLTAFFGKYNSLGISSQKMVIILVIADCPGCPLAYISDKLPKMSRSMVYSRVKDMLKAGKFLTSGKLGSGYSQPGPRPKGIYLSAYAKRELGRLATHLC